MSKCLLSPIWVLVDWQGHGKSTPNLIRSRPPARCMRANFDTQNSPRPRLMAAGERMPKAGTASAIRMWVALKSIDITFHVLSTRNIPPVYAPVAPNRVFYFQTATKQFPPIPFRETPRLPQARRLTFSHSALDVVNLYCRRSCQGSRFFYRVGPRSPAGQLRI